MTVRYSYNTQVDPPAPFVHVTISHPEDETVVPDCAALLDTAADMTVVPIELMEELGLLPVEEIVAEGLGGNRVECPAYFVDLALRDLSTVRVKVLGNHDEPYILLGRDVLNRLPLVLDGPRGVLEVE